MLEKAGIGKSMLSAAAKKASQAQRSAFFSLLRTHDFLVPVNPAASKESKNHMLHVKEEVKQEAESLIARYSSVIPSDCERAPVHLQMAALALSAQRVLLREGDREEYGWEH